MAARFEKVCSHVSNGVIPVTKYKSPKTGLTVCIADVGGPLVNGFFCLATEAHDDDGLPHTLEHLIFLGSEDYPYKGVLDMLANRCLAQGTNAWTDTDHTCYTVMTAGSQGFLNLMPIYLDHVLYPTLTDAGYVTEVHHINGEGEDAGVVYCEMQARENSGESRTHLAMLRAMYPGHCGYKSETGGIMANLRDSTSNQKVRDYHKEFYRPENLCLVITGQVDHEAVFKTLEPFEMKIEKKGELPPYVRPWQSAVPPLSATVEQTVKYPSDDEANGIVTVAWRGPQAKDLYGMSSLMIMLEYLTDTAVSPLQRDFVEIDDPYCSKVRYNIIEATESCFYIKFDNVPFAKLKLIKEKLFSVLGNLESGKEAIDMERMKSVIHRNILEALNHMENQPHETFAFMCIGDFLYGNNEQELKQRVNQIDDFKKLQTESGDFWTSMLKKYFISATHVNVIGEPSKQTAESMAEEEKQRVAKQREVLGENGLKEKGDRVEEATDENEQEAPEDMLSCLAVPDTSTMNFHKLNRHNNMNGPSQEDVNGLDLAAIPFTFCVDDLLTNFVEIQAIFDTACVPEELKCYLPLYLDLLFESPVVRDGVVIPHQDIVTQLAADTLDTGSSLSVSGGSRFKCGTFAQVAEMEIKVEVEKYSQGVKWLKEILYQIKFTEERLKIVATKMMNSVAKMKRDGRTVAVAILRDMNFNKESNHRVANFLRQHKFLTGLVERLKTDAEGVINDMTKVRDLLTNPSNLRIHMTANMKKLTAEVGNPQTPWEQHFITEGNKPDKRCTTLSKRTHELLQDMKSSSTGTIVGVGSVESQFMIQTVPCVTDYTDADLAPIMVYIECLCALEGPMWKQIRGLGLAYHYRMYCLPEQGLLYFQLFKATHVVNAYKQAKEIVDGYLTGKTPFDAVQLETAISSVLYEIIEREETVSSTSEESLLNYFRGTGQDYNRNMLGLISKVTLDDLKRVGERYFRPLFDVTKSRCAVCCQPNKVDEIKNAFKEFSRELTVMSSLEEGFQ